MHILQSQAYVRGLEADPRSERLQERRTEAEGELTGAEIAAVLDRLQLSALSAGGNAPGGRAPGRLFRVDLTLRFPKVQGKRD